MLGKAWESGDAMGDCVLKLCFTGDFSLGDRYLKRWQHQHPERPHYTRLLEAPDSFVAGVAHFFEAGRTSIVNLETVLTEAEASPFDGRKGFIGCDQPGRALSVLKALNVRAVSLANNHTMDYGERGMVETMHHLAAGGIRFFGAGTAAGAAYPLVLEKAGNAPVCVLGSMRFRARYAREYGYFAQQKSIGVDAFRGEGMAWRIARLRQERPDASIVVFPHWGANYAMQTADMRAMAERWVQAGANLIIGHGAHALQGIESVAGVPVCYSIGNFVFNSPGRYAHFNMHPYSAITHVDVGAEGGVDVRAYPIVTDNRLTDFQVRPVDEDEARHCAQCVLASGWRLQRDGLGWFLGRSEG